MVAQQLFRTIAGRDAGAETGQARPFLTHFFSLLVTKTADGLVDPKLVLSWILSTLGAPGYLIGSVVPVREAGALLPQLLLARQIQRRPIRKIFWAGGSLVQGLAALAIAAAALTLQGAQAGWAIIACLAVLAMARAACSASYKDVLARTVEKGLRGTVSGAAGTTAAILVFAFALLLSFGIIPRSVFAISVAIAVAGLLWIVGSILFFRLDEPRDEANGDAFADASDLLEPLNEDPEFRRYILVRGLFISTALAPPFLVMLGANRETGEFGNLGMLMLASSLAAIASSYVWGRASDSSSRKTLMSSGIIACAALGSAAIFGGLPGSIESSWLLALFVFVAQIAYEGTRAGRKTHLTDMPTNGGKAVYTALSNTMIGTLLFLGGAFGVLADIAGPALVLAVLAALSAIGAGFALTLSEVQEGKE